MTKPNESDTITPRAVEAWLKRKDMKGEMR